MQNDTKLNTNKKDYRSERPKKTWIEVIRQGLKAKGLNEGILLDRND